MSRASNRDQSRNNQNRQRNRGRNNRRGPNPLQRSYESNGPDVKIRGNAMQVSEKYLALARDAQVSGDPILAENYTQHAEHYLRILAAAQIANQERQQAQQSAQSANQSDDSGDGAEGEATENSDATEGSVDTQDGATVVPNGLGEQPSIAMDESEVASSDKPQSVPSEKLEIDATGEDGSGDIGDPEQEIKPARKPRARRSKSSAESNGLATEA